MVIAEQPVKEPGFIDDHMRRTQQEVDFREAGHKFELLDLRHGSSKSVAEFQNPDAGGRRVCGFDKEDVGG